MATTEDPSIDHLLALPAEALLTLSFDKLYPYNPATAEVYYKKLFRKWHPDKHVSGDPAQATKVCQHLSEQLNLAQDACKKGTWPGQARVTFWTASASYHATYLRIVDMHGGMLRQYKQSQASIFVVSKDYADLVQYWKAAADAFEMPEGHPQRDVLKIRFTPRDLVGDYDEGSVMVRIPTFPGYLAGSFKSIPPRHLVWIINRLFDMSAAGVKKGLANIGISPESVLVNPETHQAFCFEGWQLSKGLGRKAKAAPKRLLRLYPGFLKKPEVQEHHVIALIKLFGRESLGDPVGLNLVKLGCPQSLAEFLCSPTPERETVLNSWKAWSAAAETAYGKPKFVEWVNFKDQLQYELV